MSINVFFDVNILNVDDDADVAVIKEKIEIALAKEMPFIEAEVHLSGWQE